MTAMMAQFRNLSARTLIAVLVMAAWLPAGNPVWADVTAQDLPVLGDASSSLISPEMERQIGGQFLKQLHAALPTVNDPILKYWVDRHITGLAQHSQYNDSL